MVARKKNFCVTKFKYLNELNHHSLYDERLQNFDTNHFLTLSMKVREKSKNEMEIIENLLR